MGRLENAMRRAAGSQVASAADAAVDLALPSEEIADDLPNEAGPAPAPASVANGAPAQLSIRSTEPVDLNGIESHLPDALTPAVTDNTSERMLRRQVNAALATKTVVDDTMMPASREQYRRLAAALHQAQRTSGFKVVMVAS